MSCHEQCTLAPTGLRWVVPPPPPWRWQVTRQLAMERAQLLERKRREDAERRRQEEEMDRILEENRRKVGLVPRAGPEAVCLVFVLIICRTAWQYEAGLDGAAGWAAAKHTGSGTAAVRLCAALVSASNHKSQI